MVTFLLSHGADANLTCHDGTSPLHTACRRGHTEIMTELIAASAPGTLDRRDSQNGCTALHYAAANGAVSTVAQLLCVGASPDILQSTSANRRVDRSPLFYAAMGGHDECVKALLGSSAVEVDRVTAAGSTAFLESVHQGYLTTALLLAAHGADRSVEQY